MSDDKAVAVLELWAEAIPEEKSDPQDLGTRLDQQNLDELCKHMQRRRELNKAVQAIISPDELADLEALFYIGREREKGEHYEWMLEYSKDLHPNSGDVADVDQILSKPALLENVIIGARLVGRPSLAFRLQQIRRVKMDPE